MPNLKPFLNQYSNVTPGFATGVVRKGELIFSQFSGLRDLAMSEPISQDTNFRLASLTKPFTAMLILILKERKLLSIDDPLSKYIPTLPKFAQTITIRQLLSHTSGLPDHESLLYKNMKTGQEPTIYDALQVMKNCSKPLSPVGEKYLYSDAGYVILAIIIEIIAKKSYAEMIQTNIFQPLGMNRSIVADRSSVVIQNRALGYRKSRKSDRDYVLFDYDPLNYIVGDEGIYSSLIDLAKWAEAWRSPLLVCQETINEALTPVMTSSGQFSKAGLGWFVNPTSDDFYHDGSWVGFTNCIYSQGDCFAIFLSNTNDFSTEEERVNITKSFFEMIE